MSNYIKKCYLKDFSHIIGFIRTLFKVPSDFIPLHAPLFNGNEKKYLLECIDTGWISSEGPFVKKFEELLADKVERKYGIAVANGTAALDVAIRALEIGEGDEVIIPSFTIISCAQAVINSGATPVVIDADSETWNMDVTLLEEKITTKTKAIMVVHMYGLPVDMDPVMLLAQKYNLKVIEDAAEAHGLMYKGKPCGSFGDVSTFSFYPNKHITTGEGGMVVTNSIEYAERCRSLRNLCFQAQKRFVHQELGWNYRMTNMQAALGVAQTEKLETTVVQKREIGLKYHNEISNSKWINKPVKQTGFSENIYWVFGILLTDDAPFSVDDFMSYLADRKVGTRPFFWPMNEQPIFQEMGYFKGVECPVASNLARKGFYIPSGLGLSSDDQSRVIEEINNFLTQYD